MEELILEKAKKGMIRVEIEPGSPKTEILSRNPDRDSFRIAVRAPPVNGRANQELVAFLSRLLGKEVRIKSGHAGRRKVIGVI